MVGSFPVSVLVSSALGYLSGLGIGGGSLLMLWLTAAAGISRSEARLLNLMFFIPSALLSNLVRGKRGWPPQRPVFFAMTAGCGGAILGTVLAEFLPADLLKKFFGVFLVLTGIRELRRK